MATWEKNGRIGIISGLVYFLLAIVVMDPTHSTGLSTMSPATPFLLSLLIVRSRRQWGAILTGATIGSLLATSLFGFGPMAAVPMAIAKIGEVVAAVILFDRMRIRRRFLGSLDRIGRFVIAVGIIGPAIGATIAAGVVTLQYGLPFGAQWRTWFIGHSLSLIAMTPVLSLLLSGAAGRWWSDASRARRIEAAVLLGTTALVAAGVFGQSTLPLLFLPILPVMLTTFRLGLLGAAASATIVALIGGLGTLGGSGPATFLDADMTTRLQFLQFYIATTVLTAFPVAADLSRRQALYRRLRQSEARYRLLADHSADIVMGVDHGGRIDYMSPSVEQAVGATPAQLLRTRALDLIHPFDRDVTMIAHRDAALNPAGTQIVEYRAQSADGGFCWFESHIRAVVDDSGTVTGTMAMIRNVSHRKALEAELSRAASTDPLTGLVNRRVFDAALAVQVEIGVGGGGAGCVAVFDIDHFKSVNDRYGHDTGDHALQAFARIARGVMREGDIVARLGGEEFGVLFPATGIEQAQLLCERLRTTLSATKLRHGSSIVELTVSAGIAAIDGATSGAAVLRAADLALYRAKADGRDRSRLAA